MILIRHGQTEVNRIFSVTRTDPGIRDPQLTPTGRIQAAAVAGALHGLSICRLICSPYIRALETAEIISALRLPIAVEALVAERCVFACDVGSELGDLRRPWPHLTFDHLADPWWPQQEETEEVLLQRSETFCGRMAADNSFEVAVVTYWGFIRAVTGRKVANGTVLRIDPARLQRGAEEIFLPAAH